jgi:hypothetical protein
MVKVRSRLRNNQALVERRIATTSAGNTPSSVPYLAAEIGPVVYFIRTDDGLIKIGYTAQLHKRKAAYGPEWDRVLAVMPGTLAHEKACHMLHHQHLARGREYFRPAPDLIAHINEIRVRLHVPPIPA